MNLIVPPPFQGQDEKRAQILQATLELVTENGFHATPVSLIANRAGIAAGTVYVYFKSKEELINILYGELKERMGLALLAAHDSTLDFRARFTQQWRNLFTYFVQFPLEFRFLEAYSHSSLINSVTREENLRHYQPVIDFIAEGMAQGIFREMSLNLAVELVYSSVCAAATTHLEGIDDFETTALEGAAFGWYGLTGTSS